MTPRFLGIAALLLSVVLSKTSLAALSAEDAGETLCYACLSSGMRTALALNQSGVTHGMTTRRRTIMHASHVMAHSELVSNGHHSEEVLNDIRNLRPCCAACNFDMNKHNMYDYLEICGWMVGDEKEWRAWKSGL